MSTPLETIIRQSLLSVPELTSLIGERLYLVQLPQEPTYPAMTFQRISTVPYSTMNQLGTYAPGWQGMGWARFMFCAWGNGPNSGVEMDQVARALQLAMSTFNASALPWSPETLTQAPNFMMTRSMSIEPQTDPPLFKARIDYRILYQEQ